ncbi:MAG TPA: PKD domain-containing protein [Baekduia sp.]|jgi:hypothetical protein
MSDPRLLARSAAVAVAAALALVAVPGAAQAAPSWLAPTALSIPSQDAGQQQVAVDAQGDATAVWVWSDGSHNRVQTSTRPAGGSWGAPATLSAAGQAANSPQVAVDARGNVTALWERDNGTHDIVQVAVRPAGGSWSSPSSLSSPSVSAQYPRLAVDPAGDAAAIWESYDGNYFSILATARRAGTSWPLPTTLAAGSGTYTGVTPDVGLDDVGDAIAVWYRAGGGQHQFVQSSVRPAAGAWGPVTNVSSTLHDAQQPHVAVDARGDAVAVWEEFDDTTNTYAAQAATRAAANGIWQPPVDLSSAGVNTANAQLASTPDGETVAVWARSDNFSGSVQSASRPPAGGWTAPVNVSSETTDTLAPFVAIDPAGDAVAVWAATTGANEAIFGATRPAGGAWQVPARVGQSNSIVPPSVAVDPQGDAATVWSSFDGTLDTVETAALDATGPLLQGLAIPATAVAGQPVALGVAPVDWWSPLGATTWAFGDGASAAGLSVAHTFAAAGTYAVTVTGTDAVGNATSGSQAIVVAPAPAGPGGGGPAPPGGPAVVPPPAVPAALTLIHAAQSHKTWREKKKAKHKDPVGTTFSFTLGRAATVSLAFVQRLPGRKVKGKCAAQSTHNAKDPKCTRLVAKGTVTAKGKAGKNTISFTGAISRTKHLAAGTYTVTIGATDAGHVRAKPVTLTFTIVK